jgi:hypothetical protein
MVTVKQNELSPVQDGALGIFDALERLSAKPKNAKLAIKVRRARMEVAGLLEEREAVRQEILGQYAEKDEDGSNKTEPVLADGEPVMGPDGPVRRVVMDDEAGFHAAFYELLMSEVELAQTFTLEDFDGQPDGFTLESELDLLGALLLDE